MKLLPLATLALLLTGCAAAEAPAETPAEAPTQPPTEPPPMAPADPSETRAAIAAFWAWWADNQDELRANVSKGMTPALIDGMSTAVKGIHPS